MGCILIFLVSGDDSYREMFAIMEKTGKQREGHGGQSRRQTGGSVSIQQGPLVTQLLQ